MRKTVSVSLDDFDRRILDVVQENNLSPLRVIADKVGLSVPAVARRLQRLRETQVIEKDVSVVDQTLVGRPLTLIVAVTSESERLDLLDAMRDRFRACPQVQQCYYVTGQVDFLLVLNVRDMEEYTALTREIFFEGGNVESFRTFVVMDRIKTGMLTMVR
jgi:Lrp/AsnC family leucine-responsive transcriptional regulator